MTDASGQAARTQETVTPGQRSRLRPIGTVTAMVGVLVIGANGLQPSPSAEIGDGGSTKCWRASDGKICAMSFPGAGSRRVLQVKLAGLLEG